MNILPKLGGSVTILTDLNKAQGEAVIYHGTPANHLNGYRHPWTSQEINFVQKNIGKLTYKQMGKTINRTASSIQSKVRSLPLKQKVKKYSINDNFFKKWTQQMAYTLGFIAADGNLTKYNRAHMLQIACDDRDVIEKIRHEMKAEIPILKIRKRGNGKTSYQLKISNPIMFYDLLKLNITPRKSLTLKPPKVPKKYLPHYLRGFFDGDGTVWLSKRTKLVTVWYTASLKMAIFLFKYLKKVCPEFSGKIQKTIKKNNPYYSIAMSHRDSKLIFKFLYKDATIFMDRKYNKFLEGIYA